MPERYKYNGAAKKNRTSDLLITNQLLYRLSYSGNNIYFMKNVEVLQKKLSIECFLFLLFFASLFFYNIREVKKCPKKAESFYMRI